MGGIEAPALKSKITNLRLPEQIRGVDRVGILPTDTFQRRLGSIEGVTIAQFSDKKKSGERVSENPWEYTETPHEATEDDKQTGGGHSKPKLSKTEREEFEEQGIRYDKKGKRI